MGEGLYLLPSNMNLRIGTYEGYNNNILIATSDSSLGPNRAINSESQPDIQSADNLVTIDGQSLNNQLLSADEESLDNQIPSTDDQLLLIDDQPLASSDSHADEKISLIL